MTPEQALVEIGSLTAGAQIVTELAGGPASCSYLVERGADRWVLRTDNELPATLGLDRSAEAVVLAHIYKEGSDAACFGPRLEFVDVEQGIQLTRYIPGRAWTQADLDDHEKLARLAQLLQRLHGAPIAGTPFVLRDRIARYAASVGSADASVLAAEAGEMLGRLEASGARHCLCHNDLVCANVIEGDRLYLVDWEYAAVGDPFFDLATVVQHHELSDEAAAAFLQAYLGRVRDADTRRLDLYRELYARLLVLWQSVVDHVAAN